MTGDGAGGVLGAATGAEGAPGPNAPCAIADSGTKRALAAMAVNVLKPGFLEEGPRSKRCGSRLTGSSVVNDFLHQELSVRPRHRVQQGDSTQLRA